jgi:LCP family protein required for cell wall assembly
LLLLATGGAVSLAYLAQSTMSTIQHVERPPALVTDNTNENSVAQVLTSDPSGELVAPPAQMAQLNPWARAAVGSASGVEGDGGGAPLTFDTGPAQQALVDAGKIDAPASDGGGGLLGSFKDTAGNVGDLARGAAVAAGVKDPSKDAITILVMGVDARPGSPIDIGVRADALMVLHVNPTTGSCRGLAIPRDTLTELPGYGQSKINHALMVGGILYEQLVVEKFLNLPIDHYALVDFSGFKDLVDAVGGVPVTVPKDITSGDAVLFHAGKQTFDGDTALRYARYRGGSDLDIGRIRRQQEVIRGLLEVAQGRNIAGDVTGLLPAVKDHIRTDLSADQLVAFADQYRTLCGDGKLQLDTLQGTFKYATTPDPLFKANLAYQYIDDAAVREKVAALVKP